MSSITIRNLDLAVKERLRIRAAQHANGAGVVTRDIGGFVDCGVPLVDPWQALS